MTVRNALRFARRELRGGVRGFRVLLICLALSVGAITAVGTVRDSIENGLSREGASLLGGDAEITLTYRFASDAEKSWMEETAQTVSEIVDFRSMAVVDRGDTKERGLTQVKGVDGNYPIYGSVQLAPAMDLDTALAGRDGRPGAVMDPVLIGRLGLKIGDAFALGGQEFLLTAALQREPDNAGGGFGLGPRTLVRTDDLANAGLLAPGTLFESAYRLKLPPGAQPDAVEQDARTSLNAAGLRWRDSRNGAPGISEFVDRLGAFLVLVGLAGLAVGGVGVYAAVRGYLTEKTNTIATLKTLGATSGTIIATYAFQIGAVAVAGICLGLILGSLIPVAFAPIIESRLPVPIVVAVYPAVLAEATTYGVLAAAIFTLWPLARTETVRGSALYRNGADATLPRPRLRYVATTAVLIVGLVLLAGWFSGLMVLTLWSAGGLAVAFVALWLIALATRRVAKVFSQSRRARGYSALRIALGSVGGPRSEAAPVILSLGLGLTVLSAIGQIDANLRTAIATNLPEQAPSFFVVDIQTHQLQDFLSKVRADDGVSKVETAPMLRGVITRINGSPASEVVGDHWVLEGDRGVTYSAELPEGARLTAGDWWPADYTGAAQISFAAEQAAEMGLSLGDVLTVNILGRDIEGTITSFREVDFSTAGIGFILSMNPAALAGAPHSHIATIYGEAEADVRLLRNVGDTWPNVTMIRVRDAIARVAEILSGIASAANYGAAATLLTGFTVLIGAAAAGEPARTYEAAILKTLGASRRTILVSFAMRSAIFGLSAAVIAVIAGATASWATMTFVMETDFSFEPFSAAVIIFGGVLATTLAGLAFAWRPLSARPARILRDVD
ncbi:MAG: FtsX-like permease family protein [Pseudomonadota bacterium]